MNINHTFPVWGTVAVGNGCSSSKDFNLLLQNGDWPLWGNGMIQDKAGLLSHPTFVVSDTPGEVDIVLVSPRSLGFCTVAPYKFVVQRAVEMGLELCTTEVPFQARAQIRIWGNTLMHHSAILPPYQKATAHFVTNPIDFDHETQVSIDIVPSSADRDAILVTSRFYGSHKGYLFLDCLLVFTRPRT